MKVIEVIFIYMLGLFKKNAQIVAIMVQSIVVYTVVNARYLDNKLEIKPPKRRAPESSFALVRACQ